MAEEGKLAPIIIKKIKKGGHGHHGGAWKVAYADFVTAMMAFFLLLWLLSTTTKEQREGLAEYFTPTAGLNDSRGIGFEGGLTPNEPGNSKSTLTQPGLVVGQVQQGPKPGDPNTPQDVVTTSEDDSSAQPNDTKKEDEQSKQDDDTLKQTERDLLDMMDRTQELTQFKKNILVSQTPEGLKIDLVEDPDNPMYLPGTATMTDTGRLLLRAVSNVILRAPNRLSITGNTEKVAYPAGATYTGWELSADRANAARRYLSENVLEPERVLKVIGMADAELLVPAEPQSPRNRRVTLLLLRNALMENVAAPNSRGLLSAPKIDLPSAADVQITPAPAVPAPEPEVPAAPSAAAPGIFAPQPESSGGSGGFLLDVPEGPVMTPQ